MTSRNRSQRLCDFLLEPWDCLLWGKSAALLREYPWSTKEPSHLPTWCLSHVSEHIGNELSSPSQVFTWKQPTYDCNFVDNRGQNCPTKPFLNSWFIEIVKNNKWLWFLGQKDPLEEEMRTHSSILAWKIPWTEQSGGLQSMELQKVGH